jgi:hypothetical protein
MLLAGEVVFVDGLFDLEAGFGGHPAVIDIGIGCWKGRRAAYGIDARFTGMAWFLTIPP